MKLIISILLAICKKLEFIINPLITIMSLPYIFLFGLVMWSKLPKFNIVLKKIRWELNEYLDSAITKVFSDWNTRELSRKASYNLLKSVEKKDLQEIFDSCYQTLGKLIYYQTSRDCLESGGGLWSTNMGLISLWKLIVSKPEQIKHWKILANYKTEVLFEKGRAELETQIITEYGCYSINSLNIVINKKLEQHSFKLGIPATLDASKKNLHKPQMFFEFK
ncbi:MAG TPA: hypothetical protein ACFCUY_15305 [Xenococcaceae cyanobacterium]|jgi:hypothetical protein